MISLFLYYFMTFLLALFDLKQTFFSQSNKTSERQIDTKHSQQPKSPLDTFPFFLFIRGSFNGSFYLFINLCGNKLMEVQIKVIFINEAPNNADISAKKPKDANRRWQRRQTTPHRFSNRLKRYENEASLGGVTGNTCITGVATKVQHHHPSPALQRSRGSKLPAPRIGFIFFDHQNNVILS